jgi:hypothetical protein
MSTEIKNTLFRFVTMRAPELVTAEDKTNGFVFHPELDPTKESLISSATTHFKLAMNSPAATIEDQLTALSVKAATYGEGENQKLFKTKAELEVYITPDFALAAKVVAKTKKTMLMGPSIPSALQGIKTTPRLSTVKNVVLWDNLFYQIITKKNPSLRDAIINAIVANHYLGNQNVANQLRTVKASVVIPVSLFGTASAHDSLLKGRQAPSLAKILPENKILLKKSLDAHNGKQAIDIAIKATEVLKDLEKKYRKEESAKRAEFQQNYEVELNKAYKSAQMTERVTENKVTGEISIDREYTDLILPDLVYVSTQEIVHSNVANALGLAAVKLISSKTLLSSTTFTDLFEALDDIITSSNKAIEDNSEVNTKVTVIAGVPVSSGNITAARNGNLFSYVASMTFMPVLFTGGTNPSPNPHILDPVIPGFDPTLMQNRMPSGAAQNAALTNYNRWKGVKVSFTGLELADLKEDITTLSFTMKLPNNTVLFQDIYLTAEMVNGQMVFGGFDDLDPLWIPKTATSVILEATILLDDGEVDFSATINVGNIQNAMVTRIDSGIVPFIPLLSDPIPGHGNNPGDLTDPPTHNATPDFLPSRFGIKNLGVADYRKVEQSICCYEPGEVSHIENIMAREYKEKSTERSRVTENTTTLSNESEAEKLTDTTTATRYEMHNEVAQVLQEDMQIGLSSTVNQNWTGGGMSVTGSFAHNSAQEDSTTQAVTYAQDITERAMERVVSKIKSETISKVVESYKENNKHGFDNTKGDQHVSGVYRWVNKVYNNQIVNYGIRAMVEFMIPEPARFHILATANEDDTESTATLNKPIDPRSIEAGTNRIMNFSEINKANALDNYINLASRYGAAIDPLPAAFLTTGISFSKSQQEGDGSNYTNKAISEDLDVPEGYYLTNADVFISKVGTTIVTSVADQSVIATGSMTFGGSSAKKYSTKIPVSTYFEKVWVGIVNINVTYTRSTELYKKWQVETFNSIIEAYEEKLAAYNQALLDAKAKTAAMITSNPLYYRQIERNVLKKNIMHYLVPETLIGKSYLEGDDKTATLRPLNNAAFDYNASVTRFMEQAFEWDIMSYSFLPFYWGNKDRWNKVYKYQFDDALFTNFMQAGMARVILTVRPGFEQAVNWYMATGEVWNGGQTPVIGSELFLSIDQEIKITTPKPEGLPWKTTIPSDLTVIQSSTIGLEAEGLPCGCPTEVGGAVQMLAEITHSPTLIGGDKQEIDKERLTIKDGFLQLTTDGENPEVVIAQIPLETIKKELGL